MKIQCPCGAKYSVDVTPEMAARPVSFVCGSCGLDSSAAVNAMIREAISQQAVPTGILVSPGDEAANTDAPVAPLGIRLQTAAPAPAAEPVETAPVAAPPARMRLRTAAPAQAEATAEAGAQPQLCLKHSGQSMVHECLVCQKPMCPKCMETFGYICSPFCKTKAENQRMKIPVYAGQRSVAESREWRKVGGIAAGIGAVIVSLLGLWTWYAWFGSTPSPMYSVKFKQVAGSGKSEVSGKKQLVFLHGYTLARHDLKTKKEVWSRAVVDRKAIEGIATEYIKEWTKEAKAEGIENPKIPSLERMTENMMESAAQDLELHVVNSNIWVATPEKLVLYDWATGNQVRETSIVSTPVILGDDLMLVGTNQSGAKTVTHINLASTESRVEEVGPPTVKVVAGTTSPGAKANGVTVAKGTATGGPGTKGMDPAKVAEQVQRLPLAGKIALPAVVAAGANQQRALKEMEDDELDETDFGLHRGGFAFMPGQDGHVEFSAKLLEQRWVERKAMKDPPKKSALDGAVNVTQSMEVANEILNDLQRMHGADTVVEDESRYQVTVRLPGGKVPDWSAEVIGPPALYPLKTVNVLASSHELIVLDKTNKKLWQSPLTYRVPERHARVEEDGSPYGFGPCVERGDVLLVFDQAVLTAFEPATGNVRWRLPSVGISGLFFDEKGMLYVNTTTASPDSIKYSRQIDVTQKTSSIIVKVDPATGKTLWSVRPGGYISNISGKFIYIVRASGGDAGNSLIGLGRSSSAFVKIKRLNPDNGRIMWEYLEQRLPIDVRFHQNQIQLVFKDEVEVLRFLSF